MGTQHVWHYLSLLVHKLQKLYMIFVKKITTSKNEEVQYKNSTFLPIIKM